MAKKDLKIAVIKTGGKQYVVSAGSKVKVEKLPTEVGEKVTLSEVLMTAGDNDITLGEPLIKDAKVEAKVVDHARHDKVWGVKMKAKKRYRRLFGHKQHYTQLEITKISG